MLQYNGQTLAYIGDAVYELYIREKFLEEGKVHPKVLHQSTITYTNATGQYHAYKKIEPLLTDEERAVITRGRNASSARKPGKADMRTYKLATGFEALIGYLYLDGQKTRLYELLENIK